MNVPDLKKECALDEVVGRVTPCAPFVASRCERRARGLLPYLPSSSGGRLMQLIHTVGREKAAKWFAARRGEAAEYWTDLQAKLIFIGRTPVDQIKNPSPPCNFYKREATKLKEHAKDEQ